MRAETPPPFASGRDLPLDFIRGIAMFLVVINHLPIPSHFYLLTVDRIGITTGAELFVIISGIVLGMVHRQRIELRGWTASARGLFRRSAQIYLTVIAVTIVIWILNATIGHMDVLMRWTDEATGQTWESIPANPLQAPMQTAFDLLRLRLTPPEINILGFFVAISAVAPFALLLLQNKKTGWLLAMSWILYSINFFHHFRVTPGIFENPFPLLSWQLLFINALVVGYYRVEISAYLQRAQLRRALLSAATTLVVLCIFFSWNNPWTHGYQYDRIPQWARFSVIPPDLFNLIYAKAFGDRTWLFLGRLVDSAAIIFVLYAVIICCWRAAYKTLGWFFIPIGQASLYVFVMHLWMVAILALPFAQNHRMLVNDVLHTAALLTLWLMVRTRFLFKIVPR